MKVNKHSLKFPSEKLYQSLFRIAPSMISLSRFEDGELIEVNDVYCKLSGYTREELINQTTVSLNMWENLEDRNKIKALLLKDGSYSNLEISFRRKDGSILHGLQSAELTEIENERFIIAVTLDITKRKETENALQESEKLFRLFMENFPGVAFISEPGDHLVYGNKALLDFYGDTEKELFKRKYEEYVPAPLFKRAMEQDSLVILADKAIDFEDTTPGSAGERKWLTYKFPIHQQDNSVLVGGFGLDITGRKETEDALVQSLSEKENLLQELHHRVKNNLQIIAGLIDATSIGSDKRHTQEFAKNLSCKIEAMSLVHGQLYNRQNLSYVLIKKYIHQLYDFVFRLYYSPGKKVDVEFKIEGIELTLKSAVPLGLVVNEILSNIFKHAFTQQDTGKICISLKKTDPGRIQLQISDNGSGISDDIDLECPSTTGLKLIRGIILEQLQGTLEIFNDNGTVFRIELAVDGG